ncbi:MAG: DUF2752 domain-containing protein [Terracidiphilus sp.]
MYSYTDKSVAIGLLVSACAVLAVASWLEPAACGYGTHTQLGLPPCNFLRLTHLPCPSCGLTTCFAWAVRFHFWKAFLANPFGILAFFGTVSLIPVSIFLLWRRVSFRRITESVYFCKAVYAATALYLLSWIFKIAEFQFAGH